MRLMGMPHLKAALAPAFGSALQDQSQMQPHRAKIPLIKISRLAIGVEYYRGMTAKRKATSLLLVVAVQRISLNISPSSSAADL
jgi:hypothetical protein